MEMRELVYDADGYVWLYKRVTDCKSYLFLYESSLWYEWNLVGCWVNSHERTWINSGKLKTI